MEKPLVIVLITLLTLGNLDIVLGEAQNCMVAMNTCITRLGCSSALNNFQIACQKVKLGLVDHCTDSCLIAVMSLVTVDSNIGTDYLTCDCAGNEDCNLWKSRISICSTDVLRALENLDNEDVISCSLARMLCDANTKCYTALSFYENLCSNLWIKPETEQNRTDPLACTPKCNNSLSILYKQPRGSKLKNCLCDDGDPFVKKDTCIRMRYNTQKYCLGEAPTKPVVVVDHYALIDTVKSEKSFSVEKDDDKSAATQTSYTSHLYKWLFLSLTFTVMLLTAT